MNNLISISHMFTKQNISYTLTINILVVQILNLNTNLIRYRSLKDIQVLFSFEKRKILYGNTVVIIQL